MTIPQTGQTTVGGHYNGQDRAQTTHATLGQGQIVVAGTAQENVEGLNRDLGNSQEVTRDLEIGGLDASVTVDHRLLSSEGRDSIVNDAVDTMEHGEDMIRSGRKVGSDQELTLLNVGEVLHNNAQGTQLKNDLLRNPENAHILAGLKSENPEVYAKAISDLGHLAQEKFGLSLSDINIYDANATDSASLADNTLGNVKGGVVIDESSPLFGAMFLDGGDGARKTDMTATLGHEVLETQSLQGKDGGLFGANSETTQEALGDAFGEQLADRINQAAGGNLDATGGRYFAAGLKQSQAVRNGTVIANQVGTATVDHRQLYVQEARAILDNAPAYAETYKISETQAKKELIQQALLMVDKDWADQTHITENDRARDTLETIAAEQTDKARDALTRTPFNQVVHQNESDYFQADETAYNDTNLNAGEASAIEAGWAGEDNLLSRYATEHGEKPLAVAFSDSASRLGSNTRHSVEALYGAITRDPLGLAVDTVNGGYEYVVTCVTTSKCIAHDQTHGTARDRQLVAELQGNADVAVAEAADNLGATLVELTAVPGVGKAAKSGVVGLVDTAADQARKNARKDISPSLNVDGEMVGQNGSTYSGIRGGEGVVRQNFFVIRHFQMERI
jgi:filamentous hemagglutinin